MNFQMAQNKHLTHIEQTAKELLAILRAADLGDLLISEQIMKLIDATALEQLARIDTAAKQVDNASKQVSIWENEGGTTRRLKPRA